MKKKSYNQLNRINLDKIQQPVMIKFFKNLGIEGACLNVIKVIYDQLNS